MLTKQYFVTAAYGALFIIAVSKAHADAVVTDEQPDRSVNVSYQVRGKDYYPLKTIAPYVQNGSASWYGKPFHGRKTANGERYDMHAMTAAHKTLPIPSYVRVTNLSNGNSVILRINDRGPFHSDRIIDVSKAAAIKLGFAKQGVADVRVEQIVPSIADDEAAKPVQTTNQNGN